MNNQSYIAKEISDDILNILNKYPKGAIHSVFNTSFNLIFNEYIIHIGSKENGMAPFGIGLVEQQAHEFTKKVGIGMKVMHDREQNRLIFQNGCILQLSKATFINHSLIQTSFDKHVLEKNTHYLCKVFSEKEWTIGFLQSEKEKQQLLHYILDEEGQETETTQRLNQLAFYIQGLGEVESKDVFNYWMGRGSGLTPSGDDMLTGACAILTLLDGESSPYVLNLREYLLANGRQRTTDIAYEYFYYATVQKYHTHLLHVCKQLIENDQEALSIALQNLLQVGHTSGADTLLGILIGSKAYLSINS